jgi:hypothetical protein
MMLLALALAAAQPVETPQRFLERVYLSYNSPGFSPLRHPARWFTPRLVAAIREDSRLAHGEVGYLDGDPLCDCQDSDEIAMAVDRFSRASRTRATAKVHLNIGIREMRDLRLSLQLTKAGWRIADVVSSEGSLLAALRKSNAKR